MFQVTTFNQPLIYIFAMGIGSHKTWQKSSHIISFFIVPFLCESLFLCFALVGLSNAPRLTWGSLHINTRI